MGYTQKTVRQFIEELKEVAKELPDGLDSLVTSGDFECNYVHGYHEICTDMEHHVVLIGYEMHENCEDDLEYFGNEDEE